MTKIKKPNQEALDLLKEINRLEMRIIKYCSPIDAKISDLQEKLHLVCIHDETEMKHEYEEGGYFNRCKYIDRVTCKVCGKIITEKITFGGFN
jgi:hypothetical protein